MSSILVSEPGNLSGEEIGQTNKRIRKKQIDRLRACGSQCCISGILCSPMTVQPNFSTYCTDPPIRKFSPISPIIRSTSEFPRS